MTGPTVIQYGSTDIQRWSHHISTIISLNIKGNLTEFQWRSHSIPVGKPTEIFVEQVGPFSDLEITEV